MTGEERFLQASERARSKLGIELDQLKKLTNHNSVHQKKLEELNRLTIKRAALIEETIALRENHGFAAIARLFQSGRVEALISSIRDIITGMEAEESQLLATRVRSASESARQTSVMFAVGMVANLVIIALAFRYAGRQVSRLAEAEATLRMSETRFRGTFEAAAVGMAVVAPDGKWLAVNRSLCNTVGYTEAELLATDFQSITHPDDLASDLDQLQQLLAGELSSYQMEKRYVHKVGNLVHIKLSVSAVRDDAGRLLHVVALIEDITARKQAEAALRESEERFRLLVEGVRDHAILMLDPHGRIVSWNAAAMAMKGYQAEEIIGQHFSKFSIDDLDQGASPDRRLAIAQSEGRWQGEGRRKRKDGSLFWANVLISPLKDQDGGLRGFAKVTRDVTERRRVEEELRKAKEAAEAASRAKSEFLANMSHEIRTPMNGILGMTGLALDTTLTTQQREYLTLVKSSADSLLTVINDILDFSKIEAGKLDLDPIPFAFHDCIEGTLKALALRAHEKGLELACRIAPDVPRALVGDAGRLRQVLVNLVGNAIKFTERGEVVVSTEVVHREPGQVGLRIGVADTGIGIPTGKLHAIFEPFEQADGSTTRKYGGTGLGLPISSKLVELMGGRIWAESAVGCGSTFHFTMTLGECDGVTLPGTPMGTEALRGLRVIVADDHATNRKILEEFLTSWEMHPTIVDGGRAAMVEMRRSAEAGEPYPLVVLDARMPDLDGFELAEVIRSDPGLAGAAILMLSSADLTGDAARSRELGVDLHLIKPVSQAELLEALLMALGTARSATPQPADSGESMPRLRVLLAEDNVVNQRVAVRLLERKGHEVVVAADGMAALAAHEAGRFDLVLMDLHMPEMGGFEATALIRQREALSGSHTPIVAMTARAMKGDRERCLEAGMDGYIPKPVSEDALWMAIKAAVATSASAPEVTGNVRLSECGDERALLDQEWLLARVGGDAGLLSELVDLFLLEYPRLLDTLGEAVTKEDAPTLIEAAHALKGSLAYFGDSAALEAVSQLEAMGNTGNLVDSPRALDRLVVELDRLGPLLRQLVMHQAVSED